jgi:hypothetical protein
VAHFLLFFLSKGEKEMKPILLILALFWIGVPVVAKAEPQRTCFVSYDSTERGITVHATGVGFEPRRAALSPAQKRLMAQRAALVNGYRNILSATRHFPRPSDRFPFRLEQSSGFLKGVEIENTRFYSQGKVEVDLKLKLEGKGGSFEEVRRVFVGHPIPLCEVETERKYISKEEYENLFRQKK